MSRKVVHAQTAQTLKKQNVKDHQIHFPEEKAQTQEQKLDEFVLQEQPMGLLDQELAERNGQTPEQIVQKKKS